MKMDARRQDVANMGQREHFFTFHNAMYCMKLIQPNKVIVFDMFSFNESLLNGSISHFVLVLNPKP